MVDTTGGDLAGSEVTKATSASVETCGKKGHAAREWTHQAWLLACGGMVAWRG